MGFGTPTGTFADMSSLSFKARAADGDAPNLSVNLATDQVRCCCPQSPSLVLSHMSHVGSKD